MNVNIRIIHAFALAVALIFVFLIVYSPHLYYNYPYPLHYDEWLRLNDAKHFVKNGTNSIFYPSLKEKVIRPYYVYGFDIFLAEIELLTDLDLVKIYQFLPAFFIVIAALALFVLVWQISGSFFASFLSILFFALLKNNINILGLWFLLPSTFSFLFLFIIFFLLNKYFQAKERKYLFLFYLFSLILLVSYPLTLVFLIPVILLSFLINTNFKDFIRFSLPLFFSGLLVLIIFYSIGILITEHTIFDIPRIQMIFFTHLIFLKNWSGFTEFEYSLPYLFGYLAAAFAIYGLLVYFKDKKNYLVNFLALWVMINLLLFKFFGFTVLSFYQRILYLGFITLSILASIGLVAFFKKIKRYWADGQLFLKKTTFLILILIVLTVVFYQPIKNYYNIDPRAQLNKIINQKDIKALDYIKNNYQEQVILAPALFSVTIYPLTYNYVAFLPTSFLPASSLEDRVSNFEYYDPFLNFVNRDDLARKKIAEAYNVDLVYSLTRIDSDILKLVYNENNRFIYEVAF